jgi:hypothetical protein
VDWKVERGAQRNYRLLGRRLAEAHDRLYRNGAQGNGLIRVQAAGATRLIQRAADLVPLLVDTLTIQVTKEGKVVGDLPAAVHLNAMLRSEAFLSAFRPVDQVAKCPLYLPDFSVARPGYQECPEEGHLLYVGPPPEIRDSFETIDRFLAVMDFATNADRTNAIAAALTVLLRNHWLGAKPLVLVTATKSHSGKGTITEFIRGDVAKADILYESTDWPMQSQLQRQLAHQADLGIINLDNARLDSAGGKARFIRSAFLESFLTQRRNHPGLPGCW